MPICAYYYFQISSIYYGSIQIKCLRFIIYLKILIIKVMKISYKYNIQYITDCLIIVAVKMYSSVIVTSACT